MDNLVHLLDKKYGGKNAPLCPFQGKQVKIANHVTEDHGRLGVHGSGAFLICGVCGHKEPTARVD